MSVATKPTSNKTVKAQPFLKWAGGKTQLLDELIKRVPAKYNVYFEPFIGGGALYFAIAPEAAVIADINDDLVNAYLVVRDNPDELLEALSKYKNEKDFYYSIRSQDQSRLSKIERAARLLYLNRTCFNGLYRVNKNGQFNVPFANYKNPNFVQTDRILAASEILQNTDVYQAGFEKVLVKAKAGDFIYLDPPYYPKDVYSDFKRYNKEQFHKNDHERLAELYNKLTERGCYVMLSNSDTPFTREHYKEWRVDTVYAKRLINKDASKRGEVTEIIVTNYDY
ncbi:MAG: Modification methylase DpnIIA [candidate division WS6 bacterium OLB21]|uniref:Site-specific DNA-methyltransferase (adenine-specific) n=1 Tax=candidate division WS6 bacterium OLB21 TaxID=1617427 RepID=A0A136KIK7_9BACT|nr:MAG: Modification methylase DpnIIA [candidate division WS6 bacterium OLB21]